MSIGDNIKEVKAIAQSDQQEANRIKADAIAAIYKGFGSPEWNIYMHRFAKTPAELARLTTTATDDCHPYIAQSRAYLVANAVCFPGTTDSFEQGIEDYLDRTLQ